MLLRNKFTITLIFLLLCTIGVQGQQPYKRTLKLMGSRFDITVVGKDSLEANGFIDIPIPKLLRLTGMRE